MVAASPSFKIVFRTKHGRSRAYRESPPLSDGLFSQAAHLSLGSFAFDSNEDALVESENGAFPELPRFLKKCRQISFCGHDKP